MTALTHSPTDRRVGEVPVDSLISAVRRWLEDRLPWYDRREEEQRIERTEDIRQRSIQARIRAEALQAERRFRGQ